MFLQEEELMADTVSQFLMRKSLTKKQILRLKTDIDRTFKAGKRYSLSCFKLFVAENGLPYSRMIVIPVRHYGNSVCRNRIRRQVREIWRTNQQKIKSGLDCVIIVHPGEELPYSSKEEILLSLFGRGGMLADR